jgi:hypothetical protein
MFPVWLTSDRLKTKDVVFAVIVNGRPKAYPIEILKREGVTQDGGRRADRSFDQPALGGGARV